MFLKFKDKILMATYVEIWLEQMVCLEEVTDVLNHLIFLILILIIH